MKKLLVHLAFAASTLPVLAQAPPTAPALVTTTGESEIRVEPDEVRFAIELNTQGPDLAAAKEANARLAVEAIAYLESAGVPARDIQTRYLNVDVEYRDYRERSDPRYVANQSVSVLLRDVAAFEAINAGLLERGVTGLSGPSFGSSREDSLRAEARVAAVRDARDRAEALAGALGQTIGSAYRIDASAAGPPRYDGVALASRASAESAAPGPGIATGELVVEQRVTVSFYLRS